jgi:hypothetical protein
MTREVGDPPRPDSFLVLEGVIEFARLQAHDFPVVLEGRADALKPTLLDHSTPLRETLWHPKKKVNMRSPTLLEFDTPHSRHPRTNKPMGVPLHDLPPLLGRPSNRGRTCRRHQKSLWNVVPLMLEKAP